MIPFTDGYSIRVLHTPGHTPESVVYLLTDKATNTPVQVLYNNVYNYFINLQKAWSIHRVGPTGLSWYTDNKNTHV